MTSPKYRPARTPSDLVVPNALDAAARRMDEMEMNFVSFISAQQEITRKAFDSSAGRNR